MLAHNNSDDEIVHGSLSFGWRILQCELHGVECPNANNRQPGYNDGSWRIMTHQTPLAILDRESKSKCPIGALFAMVGILRRAKLQSQSNRNIKKDFEEFFKKYYDNIWFVLNKADPRVHMSILDTYADYPETQSAGTAAVIFLKMDQLAATVLWQEREGRQPRPLVCGDFKAVGDVRTAAITPQILAEVTGSDRCLVAPDTLTNMLLRLRSTLFNNPPLWLLFYELLRHDLKDNNLFKQYDRMKPYVWVKPEWGWPEIAIEDHLHNLLRPAPISYKYLGLYKKQHEGWGTHENYKIPEHDLQFLLNSGSKNVLDFGCGQGHHHSTLLHWNRYDPCKSEFSQLPYRGFDSLVSYDVLEHIPIDEIKTIAKWFNLFATRSIVLGISTIPASAILANGENAHCTVQSPDWWAVTMQKFLPQFKMVWEMQNANYVTLHFLRNNLIDP